MSVSEAPSEHASGCTGGIAGMMPHTLVTAGKARGSAFSRRACAHVCVCARMSACVRAYVSRMRGTGMMPLTSSA